MDNNKKKVNNNNNDDNNNNNWQANKQTNKQLYLCKNESNLC